MALRAGHGKGAGQPRIEVLPIDELPVGVPADARHERPGDRGPHGQFARGNGLAERGGRSRGGKTRLAERLGLAKLGNAAAFAPYKRSAVSFRRAQCSELARSVGGGRCGPAPSSFVASAALQLAWSRYFSDEAAQKGDPQLALAASRLADASRQNLLAAHELCAREAASRPKENALARLHREMGFDKVDAVPADRIPTTDHDRACDRCGAFGVHTPGCDGHELHVASADNGDGNESEATE